MTVFAERDIKARQISKSSFSSWSVVSSKISANCTSFAVSGNETPCSHLEIDCLDTDTISAKFSWDKPLFLRRIWSFYGNVIYLPPSICKVSILPVAYYQHIKTIAHLLVAFYTIVAYFAIMPIIMNPYRNRRHRFINLSKARPGHWGNGWVVLLIFHL